MRLNLGCGKERKDGHVNLDKEDYGQEIVRDVARGLPFDSEKFEAVYSSHFLEHIEVGEELYFLTEEIYRVLVPGGTFAARVPHRTSEGAWYPDHKSFWSEAFVRALCEDEYQGAKRYHFEIVELKRVGDDLHFCLRKDKKANG